MPVDVVAIISPAPGKEARVKELLIDLASKVHKHEPDVSRYQPYEQSGPDATTDIVVIERYKDEETLKAHGGTEYFQELGKTIGAEGLLAKGLNIMVLKPLSSGFDSR